MTRYQGPPESGDADLPRPARRTRPVAVWLGCLLLRAASQLPLSVVHALGGGVGWIAAHLPLTMTRRARVNLRMCFPDLSLAQRRRLLRRSLQDSARMVLELGPLWSWPRPSLQALIRDVQGRELLDAAHRSGQGAIVVAPHLGSWEMLGLYCSLEAPVHVFSRPQTNTRLDEFSRHGRQRFGAALLPADTWGVRGLLSALRRGEIVMILPDQDPGPGAGVFAPFFGRPAWTSSLIPRLVRRSRARVILGCAERLAKGQGFRLSFTPGSAGIASPDLVAAATALNADIERLVRRLPEQYLWRYRRFKTRPRGWANPYRSRRPRPALRSEKSPTPLDPHRVT